MSNGDYVLRPEAGPVGPALLNRSQREAFSAVVAALDEANRLAAKSVEPGAVQRDRVSRLFFVSGQPGSGKTSLYLTLRAILGEKERSGDLRKEYEKDTELSKGLSSGLVDGTRWLEPIDFEAAVDEGENLLAAVLVRIFDAIGDSFDASKKCRDALQDLEELANDIGIAWDGNLKARAGSLDPDSYSQEVMRGQRTRLHTNERLRTPLETLFREQCFALDHEQLFVLPIDDFYLKPAASLELLRLLRMISVPRLFFLIMGDIKTVEALFFEKALADWTKVAGPRIFASLAERQQEVLGRVREMKARYLRKLLPIGQRAVIEWTQWDEALAFRPATPSDAGWVPQLCHLLSSVRICWQKEHDKKERNLLNYLVAPRLPKPRDNEDCGETARSVRGLPRLDDAKTEIFKPFREAYSGLLVLDATPRESFDLWMRLRKFKRDVVVAPRTEVDHHQPPRYLRMIVDLAVFAIEEQDFLDEVHQDILRFVFPMSDRDDLLVRTDALRLTQKVGPWRCVPSGEVLVRGHLDWELRFAEAKTKAKRKGSNRAKSSVLARTDALPPRLAPWIILLHDLVWNWKPEYLVDNLVHSLREQIDALRIPITSKMDPAEPGWAWYMEKDTEQWVHFPFPVFDTFRQMDRFLAIWNHRLRQLLPPERDPRDLEKETLEEAWNEVAEIAQGSDDEFNDFVQGVGEG